MSIEAVAKASKITSLPSTTKFVLIALSNYADDKGEAWPKQSTLAEWCSMSRETVLRHLSTLEEKGYLSSQQRHYDDGRFASKVYRLEFLKAAVKPCDAQPCDAQPCDGGSQHRVTERHTVRVTEDHNNNHHLDPSTVERGARAREASPPIESQKTEEPKAETMSAEAKADELMRTGKNVTVEVSRVRAKLRRLSVDFAEANEKRLVNWTHHSDRRLEELWAAADPDVWKNTDRATKRRSWNYLDLLSGEISPPRTVSFAAELRADLVRRGVISA